jgi:hypothetical protein
MKQVNQAWFENLKAEKGQDARYEQLIKSFEWQIKVGLEVDSGMEFCQSIEKG